MCNTNSPYLFFFSCSRHDRYKGSNKGYSLTLSAEKHLPNRTSAKNSPPPQTQAVFWGVYPNTITNKNNNKNNSNKNNIRTQHKQQQQKQQQKQQQQNNSRTQQITATKQQQDPTNNSNKTTAGPNINKSNINNSNNSQSVDALYQYSLSIENPLTTEYKSASVHTATHTPTFHRPSRKCHTSYHLPCPANTLTNIFIPLHPRPMLTYHHPTNTHTSLNRDNLTFRKNEDINNDTDYYNNNSNSNSSKDESQQKLRQRI